MRAVKLLLLAALCASAPARAEEKTPSAQDAATAKQLFDGARALMKQHQDELACPKFAESLRLDPHLGVRMNLALCYERIGWTASAWVTFRDAESEARRAGDDRADTAAEHADALEQKLERLVIAVPGAVSAAPGLRITRDGKAVPQPQWGIAVPVDPGVHVIAAEATGKLPWNKRVKVDEQGATYRVTVPELAPAPLVAVAPASPSRAGQRVAGFVIGGLGLGGLLAGAALGVAAIDKNRASKASCLPDDPNQCTADGAAQRDSAIALGNGSTAALVAGGAAAVAGLVLVITSRPAAKKDASTPFAPSRERAPRFDWALSLGASGPRWTLAW